MFIPRGTHRSQVRSACPCAAWLQEHLASGPAHAAEAPPMRRIHTDQALQIFCNTCNILGLLDRCCRASHRAVKARSSRSTAGLHHHSKKRD